MNKRKITSWLLLASMLISFFSVNISTINSYATNLNDKRACWVSYLDINDYLKDKNESDFRNKVSNMFNNVKNNGMNTVIVQVRAMGDAIYPSTIYPWSTYIDSNRNNPEYDPFKIMVEIAHKKGLKIEAWFNPYRLTNSDFLTNNYKETLFYKNNTINIIEYKGENGQTSLALDPSKKEVRDIILNGVMEVVKNYSIDGVHFDDYFYFTNMANDLDINQKKNNVNALISAVYSSIKAYNPNVVFGISPAGNTSYARSIGADIDTWLSQKGYIDYIMPQIYWSDRYILNGKETKLYTDRINEWKNLNKIGIDMYVGLALYRVSEASTTDLGWINSSTNLKDQYKIAHDIGYKGYSLFRYAWLEKSIATTELINLKTYSDSINDCNVFYSTHIQSIGWQDKVWDGQASGTTGQAKRLEGIKIQLGDKISNGGIKYRTHVQSYGWLPWSENGNINGTTGEAKRMEAIEITLTGEAKDKFDVYYRVHAQSYGWLGWAKNGGTSGTTGLAKRLEAIEIVIVKKGDLAPGSTANSYKTNNIMYKTHVQTYGWQNSVFDGSISGTSGEAKRLESITISQINSKINCGITYRTHCQTYGWLDWVKDGQMSGTTGEAKRLEAIEIKLTGEDANKHDIYYKVHVQSYGWQNWVKNGESAGTTGEGKRLEAIMIKIVPKGSSIN